LWPDVTYEVIVFTQIPLLCRKSRLLNHVLKVKMPIDIELLIELHRSEAGLWDSGNANYLHMDVMEAALRRFAVRLGSEVTGGIKKYYFYIVS